MNKNTGKYQNDSIEKLIIRTFIFPGLVVLFLSQLYYALNSGVLLNFPLTGSLIVWTHLHTIGVITPFFMGIGWYYLQNRYKISLSSRQVVINFITLYGSLIPFLYFISDRTGSPGLSISALALFVSGSYYISVFAVKLYRYGKLSKENRNFEFWIDAASLYFLLQVVMFGFVLALNLSYGFLRREEIHSLRLHSHSGITGYWLLQFILLIYRISDNPNGKNKNQKWMKLSALSTGLGLFVWTSVHDRFPVFFYLYAILAGLSLVFLFFYLISTVQKSIIAREIIRDSIIFSLLAFFVGIFMILRTQDLIYEKHIPFIYAYLIFYGVFVFIPAIFLSGKTKIELQSAGLIIWLYRFYLKLLVLVAASVYFEKQVFLQVFLAGVLILMAVSYFLILKRTSSVLNN